MLSFIIVAAFAVLSSSLAGQANAHSWLEQLQAISSNGSYIGDYGYSRGYMSRTEGGYDGNSMDYLLPALTTGRTRINDTDLLCHPSQRTSNYSSDYPRLKVNPGGYVAMKYLENGHVTLPSNQLGKPRAAGTVFVYGTVQPKEDESIVNVLEWTKDGKGGDHRGTLLTAQNFDDGRCYQINGNAISVQRQQEFPDHVPGQPESHVEQWCETDLQVPQTQATASSLTLYWVWQWPTAPGADPTYPDGKDEYYTTCAEVEVVQDEIINSPPVHTLEQQDPQSTACSDYKGRTAYTDSPSVTTADDATTSTAINAANTSPSSLAAVSTTSSIASAATTSTLGMVTVMVTATSTVFMTSSSSALPTTTITTTMIVTAISSPSALPSVESGTENGQHRKRRMVGGSARFRT